MVRSVLFSPISRPSMTVFRLCEQRIIDDAADDNSPINFPDPSMLSERAAALCGIRYAVFWHLDETGNGDTNQDKLNPFLLTTAATTRMAHALTKGYKQAAVAGFPLDKDWWIAFQVHALDFSTLRTRLIRIQQDKFTPKGFDLLAALAMKTHLAFCAQQIPKAVAARSPPEWVLREALPKALETLLHGTPLLETLQLYSGRWGQCRERGARRGSSQFRPQLFCLAARGAVIRPTVDRLSFTTRGEREGESAKSRS